MMINLNADIVDKYKEKHGITETYNGDLLSLVDVQFPEQMEADEQPPFFDFNFDDYDEVDDEVTYDDYLRREESDTEDESEEDVDDED